MNEWLELISCNSHIYHHEENNNRSKRNKYNNKNTNNNTYTYTCILKMKEHMYINESYI